MVGAIILQVILIFMNAVFASAEIAVISMSDAKLRHTAQEGDKRARRLAFLTEQPAKFLATIQVAITLAGLLGGAFAADNFAGPLVSLLVRAGVPVPESVLHSAVLVVITLVLTFFSLVFGELVPKRIAMKKAEFIALGMSNMLYFVSKLFAPLVWLLTASTNGVLRVLGVNPDEEDEVVTEEEIRMMLAEGKEQGTIQEEERRLIQNVFEFDDTSAEQVSTHRRDVVFLDVEDGEEVWAKTIQESRHTYYPVCEESADNVIGILDTKDYFRSENRTIDYLMEHAVDKPVFVPEGMRANALFNKMKQAKNYFAVVLDEYGGITGIVTMHDLLELLVGEIEEEEAPPKPDDIEKLDEETWRVQGDADLQEVAETFHVDFPVDVYDTFNGLICGTIGRIPAEGEHFTCETCGLVIEVMNVKNHTVEYALVRRAVSE